MVGGAVKAYKIAKDIPNKIEGSIANRQGNAKAYDAAMKVVNADLQAKGKTASQKDLEREALKTLGEAKWNKVVNDTEGGKLAKDILESMKKANAGTEMKTDIKTNSQTNPNNDSMEFII